MQSYATPVIFLVVLFGTKLTILGPGWAPTPGASEHLHQKQLGPGANF